MYTVVDTLIQRKEGTVIINDKLYFPHKQKGYMQFNNQEYTLEAAGTLTSLEHSLFNYHRRDLLNKKSLRATLMQESLAFTPHSHEDIIQQEYAQVRGIPFSPIEEIESTATYTPLLRKILPFGTYIRGEKVYQLYTQPSKDRIITDSQVIGIHPWKNTQSILESYRIHYTEMLHATLPQQRRNKLPLDITESEIKLNLNPYTLTTQEGDFNFNSVEIGLKVDLDDTISIQGPPYIITPDYHHPHVFADGSICFNGYSRWERLNIEFGEKYRAHVGAYKIALCLNEAHNIVTQFFGNTLRVHELTQENFPDAFIDQHQ